MRGRHDTESAASWKVSPSGKQGRHTASNKQRTRAGGCTTGCVTGCIIEWTHKRCVSLGVSLGVSHPLFLGLGKKLLIQLRMMVFHLSIRRCMGLGMFFHLPSAGASFISLGLSRCFSLVGRRGFVEAVEPTWLPATEIVISSPRKKEKKNRWEVALCGIWLLWQPPCLPLG